MSHSEHLSWLEPRVINPTITNQAIYRSCYTQAFCPLFCSAARSITVRKNRVLSIRQLETDLRLNFKLSRASFNARHHVHNVLDSCCGVSREFN
jgi:hypothetical protein